MRSKSSSVSTLTVRNFLRFVEDAKRRAKEGLESALEAHNDLQTAYAFAEEHLTEIRKLHPGYRQEQLRKDMACISEIAALYKTSPQDRNTIARQFGGGRSVEEVKKGNEFINKIGMAQATYANSRLGRDQMKKLPDLVQKFADKPERVRKEVDRLYDTEIAPLEREQAAMREQRRKERAQERREKVDPRDTEIERLKSELRVKDGVIDKQAKEIEDLKREREQLRRTVGQIKSFVVDAA